MPRSAVSIIIPAFNEENTIGSLLAETTAVMDSTNLPYEIIVVDDGSIDQTNAVASAYKTTVISHCPNRGKGYAERRAFEIATGDIVVTLDADGAHSPKEIPDLLEPVLNGTDIVSGSRFLSDGRYSISKLNMFGNICFNLAIMLLTGKNVTDSQTGFRAIKKETLDKLHLTADGYEIETEITVKGLRNGFTFQEKPITCNKREYDHSKLRIFSDGIKILKTIITANITKIDH